MRVCQLCVMDESDKDISFDDEGVCNHCRDANENLSKYQYTDEQAEKNLATLKQQILNLKEGEYDCLIGLSGGVDSSYVAYLAHKIGLNALCVHFDNGWNSDIAVSNIEKIIKKTGFDLVTYVMDWPEFRDLQRSFFKAGVIDIELITDQAIYAAMFDLAKKHKIKSVLSGSNYATEHGFPRSWNWLKQDLKNLKAIQKQFGTMQIKRLPMMGILKYAAIRALKLGATFFKPLDVISFSKERAMVTLAEEFDWRYYGGKHYESTFTKFYQAHVLPVKFGVDKRKCHLSAQIRNGEITREQAIGELKKPLYDAIELRNDLEFVAHKLNFEVEEFEAILQQPPIAHDFYPSDINFARKLIKIWDRRIATQ